MYSVSLAEHVCHYSTRAFGPEAAEKVSYRKEPACSCCSLINQRYNMPNHNPTRAHGACQQQMEQFDWLLHNGFCENVNVDSV